MDDQKKIKFYYILYQEITQPNQLNGVKQQEERNLPELFWESKRVKTEQKNYNQMVMNLDTVFDDSFSQKVKVQIEET